MSPRKATPDFEYLEHTSEVGIAGYGTDEKQAFSNVARGMFNLIVDLGQVEERESLETNAEGEGAEELLANWLNELIYLFDVEHFLFRRFEVQELTDTHIRAAGYGERIDPGRHRIKLGIKSATYHQLEVKRGKPWRAKVIVDV